MKGCLSSYIDQQLIAGALYYGHGDNEGPISTLPATCTVLLGALAGHWLRSDRPDNCKNQAIWPLPGQPRMRACRNRWCCRLGSYWLSGCLVVPVST
ncbi:MAG: hypothetical protein ACYSWQ_07340 [Planctomycetota bacterium]